MKHGAWLVSALVACSDPAPSAAPTEPTPAPGDPLAATPPHSAPIDAAVLDGNLPPVELPPAPDRIAIRRVMQANMKALTSCYEKRVAEQPASKGALAITFTIESDGSVSHATASGFDSQVDTCVAEHVKKMRFPEGNRMTIKYPILFAADQ